MPIRDNEFEELRGFLGYFVDHQMSGRGMQRDTHPINVLNDLRAQSPSQALQGLRMAINDCIEMTSTWPPGQVAELDNQLRQRGLLTLSNLRRRYSKRLQSVLKRGRITTEVEYYLVRGAVEDTELTRDDVTRMQRLLSDFEEESPKRTANSRRPPNAQK
jgi:hypothetical protein